MCGINGIFSFRAAAPDIDRDELLRTREAMVSRGPDDAGSWTSADHRIGLAARRLAILDLSRAGSQPMAGEDGRVQLVLNGEIYNFRELRGELEAAGCRLRSSGDTEVVLALYLRHGEAMLRRLRGMFALAIWDERDGHPRRLLLARDPLGIKPLYYSEDAARGQLRFASQVKALEKGGAVSRAVDPAGLAGFLLWGSVPEPLTIRRDVSALRAGYLLVAEEGRQPEVRMFASIADAFSLDRAGPPHAAGAGPDAAGVPGAELTAEAAIEASVVAHLVSDVPVAIFLSAGLDSGLVAAIASRHLPEPPRTLTLSFDVLAGTPLDEGPLAAEVALELGILDRHVERRIGREDSVRLWQDALKAMDQPSIDGFNSFAVSRVAHEEGIKVALSGLGGDEIFGTYPSFVDVPRWMRAARWGKRVPGLAKAWPALAGLAPRRPKLAGLLELGATLPGSYFLRRALYLPMDLERLMGREEAAAALLAFDPIQETGRLLHEAGTADACSAVANDHWLAVHLLESSQYIRNQLLRDSDWASMACSVELRVPLVDAVLHRQLVDRRFEPAREEGKAALVRSLAPNLPKKLWHRPKSGFYIPLLEWLQPGTYGHARNHLGLRSRALAHRVLQEGFDIELPGAAGAA